MNSKWSTDIMPDLSDKVIIVTGANSGIGFEASKVFAAKGAKVILACRNLAKGQSALVDIKQALPDVNAKLIQLDLSRQASVREFVKVFKENYDHLDILVNNAGIMMTPYSTTEDGFESQLATNHLGHFALTGLLLEQLLKTEGARVVNISSNAHKSGTMDFDNLMFEGGQDYAPMKSYARSKLANLLFTYELQRYFEAAGSSAIAVAAHPGGSNTNLASHFEDRWYFRLLRPLLEVIVQSAEQGALPMLRAAADSQVKGSDYFGPDGFGEIKGAPVLVKANNNAQNEVNAKKLWEVSEQLTGVTFSSSTPPEDQA